MDTRATLCQRMVALPAAFRTLASICPVALVVCLALSRAFAQTNYYWNLNGSAPGSGASGTAATWDTTTPNWDLTADGTGTSVDWVNDLNNSAAVFSGGSDATGAYTVSVSGTIQTNSITFNNGAVTLYGQSSPSLNIGSRGITIASTINGPTTLDSSLGNVVINAAQSWLNNGSQAFNVNSNIAANSACTLTLAGAGTGLNTINGVIADGTGALSLTVNGGSWAFANANAYTGTTTIDRGILALGNATALGSGTLNLQGYDDSGEGGGTIQASVPGITLANNTVVTGWGGAVVGTNTLTISGAIANTGANSLTNNITGDGNGLVLAGNVYIAGTDPWSVSLYLWGSGTTTINGTIANNNGDNSLSRILWIDGDVYLNGINTYTGTAEVWTGTLNVGNSHALGGGDLLLGGYSWANGTLQASVPGITLPNNVTLTAAGAIAGPNSLTISGTFTNGDVYTSLASSITGTGNGLLLAGNVYLSWSNSCAETLTISGTGTTTITGAITNNSGANTLASNLTYTGSGTLVLAGANTYTGATTVAAGTLQVGNGTSGSFSSSSLLILNGGATFLVLGDATGATSQTVNGIALNGYSTIGIYANGGGGATLNLGAVMRNPGAIINVVTTSSATLTTTNTNFVSNNVFVNAAANGTAFLTFNQIDWASLSSGIIMPLSAGAGYQTGVANYKSTSNIDVTNGDAPAAGVIVNSLRFNSPGIGLTLTGPNTISTGGVLVTQNATSANIISGGSIGPGGGKELVIANYGAVTISSVIADSSAGASGLTVGGTGVLTLAGANTYTGNTYFTGSQLNLNNANALGSNAGGGTLTMYGGVIDNTSGSDVVLASNNAQTWFTDLTYIGSANSRNLGTGTITFPFDAPVILTVTSHTLTVGGVNALDLTKAGAGTFAVSGTVNANAIEVNAGTLIINGSVASDLVSINGGTLQLGGDITADPNWITPFKITNAGTLAFDPATSQVCSAVIDGSGNVYKLGSGVLILSGANRYGGNTVISAGSLIATGASALGSGTVTVGGGASLDYFAATSTPLVLSSSLTLSNPASIGASIGATSTSGSIAVTGAVTASGAGIAVNVYGISGVAPATGTYTLVSAAGGFVAGGATYKLGTIYNNTNFTLNAGSLSAHDTSITVGITSATPLTGAYWKGGLPGNPNVWAVSDGSTVSNWTTNSAGTAPTGRVPGSAATVTISATGATNQGAMILGSPISVAGVVVTDTTPVVLADDGNTLTLGSGGLAVASGASLTIATPIAIVTSQSWTNNSSHALNISGPVNTPIANYPALTLGGNGSGLNTVGGAISGSYASVTISGGTWVFASANHYMAPTAVTNGTLRTAIANAIPSSEPLTISGGTLDLCGCNQQVVSLSDGGRATGTITSSSGHAVLTIQEYYSSTFSGTIAGSGLALTLSSSDTLTLTGANTYAGGTVVSGGTLQTRQVTTSLTIASGAKTVLMSSGGTNPHASIIDGPGNLSIATTAGNPRVLDLTDNGLIITGATATTESTIASLIAGGEITSSVVSAHSGMTIAYDFASNIHLNFSNGSATWGGQTISQASASSDLLILPTLAGDLNMDGAVNVADIAALAPNLGKAAGQTWAGGDLNGDGAVNAADIARLAPNLGQKVSSLAAPNVAMGSDGVATMPEPASGGLLMLASVFMLPRRHGGRR